MTGDRLGDLHRAAMRTSRPWSSREIADLLTADGVFLVDQPDGFALGRVTLDEAELLTIAVDPEYQRNGIGTQLLARFEAGARARGAASAFLEVAADNAPARALYAAAGWQEAGVRHGYYTRPGGTTEDALILRKRLL